ncbi:MAG: XRE family transcriptional regulator, partial [Motiliproteus sp.]
FPWGHFSGRTRGDLSAGDCMMNAKLPEQASIVEAYQRKQHSVQWSAASEQLGAQLKAARKRYDLTLKALSEKSGVAASTLSKIENNQLSPSFQIVQQVVQALELDLPQLFAWHHGEATLSRRALTRRSEGGIHPTPTYEHRLLASDLSQKKMLPFTSTIRARSLDHFDGWVCHEGEEFFFVLSGSVEMHSDVYEPVLLGVGDSAYFDSTMGHALISVSEEDAEVIWVVSLS